LEEHNVDHPGSPGESTEPPSDVVVIQPTFSFDSPHQVDPEQAGHDISIQANAASIQGRPSEQYQYDVIIIQPNLSLLRTLLSRNEPDPNHLPHPDTSLGFSSLDTSRKDADLEVDSSPHKNHSEL
jgi:hypothetical protein